MNWISKLACRTLVAASVLAAPCVQAQLPPPPALPPIFVDQQGTADVHISAPDLPRRDIHAEVKRMTKAYDLSKSQASQVSTILKEETKKWDPVLRDIYGDPIIKIQRLMAIRKEEYDRVSAVLTPDQREKYKKDMQPAQLPAPPSSGTSSPQPLPPLPSLPKRDIAAEVKRMTVEYNLSKEQASQASTILEEETQKLDAVFKDNNTDPITRLQRLLTIRKEEYDRVSAVLTPDQQAKYKKDIQSIQLPAPSSPGQLPPLPFPPAPGL
jgi:Spy/CpxP family protein refolding chaperone